MSDATNWKPSNADSVWKIMVCARDASRASELLRTAAYILKSPGGANDQEAADILRGFSGDQIADALLAYQRSAYQSVEAALSRQSSAAKG